MLNIIRGVLDFLLSTYKITWEQILGLGNFTRKSRIRKMYIFDIDIQKIYHNIYSNKIDIISIITESTTSFKNYYDIVFNILI